MRMLYYDRQGKPLDTLEWAPLFESRAYREVAATKLPNGVSISTVWLGMDHSFSGPPIIFESMVFAGYGTTDYAKMDAHWEEMKKWQREQGYRVPLPDASWQESFGRGKRFGHHRVDVDCTRYATEERALFGHRALIAKWSKCPGPSFMPRVNGSRVPRKLKKRLLGQRQWSPYGDQ